MSHSLSEQAYIVESLDAFQAKFDAAKTLKTETTAKLNAMLAEVIDGAFKREL